MEGICEMGIDYAFSDEEAFPEGWPDLDSDEILLGEWIQHKTPSSVAMRRFLFEATLFFRANLPSRTPAARLEGVRSIRELLRKHRLRAAEMEASLLDLRKELLPDFRLWIARTKGGIV
jgi:hypothetical protein